jgi:hypothetical protein
MPSPLPSPGVPGEGGKRSAGEADIGYLGVGIWVVILVSGFWFRSLSVLFFVWKVLLV